MQPLIFGNKLLFEGRSHINRNLTKIQQSNLIKKQTEVYLANGGKVNKIVSKPKDKKVRKDFYLSPEVY